MFKGFTQERLAQIMAIGSAPPKYNRALIFSFKFKDGQPVVSHVRTFKGVKPDDVRVVITSGIAIVPLDLPPDVAWLQLVKKLGAFAVELECEGGDAPGYSPIRVSQDAVKRKLKNKLQFTARVASHLVDRLESLIEGPEGSRAAVIDYAIQRLTDDLYAQALSKIERDHPRDCLDVECMFRDGHVKPDHLQQLFAQIEHQLIRYPSVDAITLKQRLMDVCADHL